RPAPFQHIFRRCKGLSADPAAYEQEPACARYRHHWQGLEHRTGLPYPVRKFEDLFVTSVSNYDRCDRFDGRFDQPWNMGEENRFQPSSGVSTEDRRHWRACDLAIAGDLRDARLLLEGLDHEEVQPKIRALVKSDLAALAVLRGERHTAAAGLQAALALDSACSNATQNIALLEEVRPTKDPEDAKPLLTTSSTAPPQIKVAVISLLFNWPTTGGGNVHNAQFAPI